MALQFVIRINRKASPRIGVLRMMTDDKKEEIVRYKNLGSLNGLAPETLNAFAKEKKLTSLEQYQLENYAAHLKFNEETFNATPEELTRNFIYFSPRYEKALSTLWQLAKQYNIAFCPAEIQQNALLHKAKAVERKINELSNKKPIKILEDIGLDISRSDKNEINEKLDKSTPKLFNLILKIDKPLSDLCNEFMQIARVQYKKNLSLKPHYFKEYATHLKRLPLWYSTVAVDLLMKHHINPLSTISPDKIATHWVRLRKDRLLFEDAFAEFKKIFKPKASDEPTILEALEMQYKSGISTANA